MKQVRQIMGMPVIIELPDPAPLTVFNEIFAYFWHVDSIFSTYKANSQISRLNRGEIAPATMGGEMQLILNLAGQTKRLTGGYFDIARNGLLDPSGIVKGWAIHQAAQKLKSRGYKDFYVEAGGDIELGGNNLQGQPWAIGIRNPFNRSEIVKIVYLINRGVATSGTYERGAHIYTPQKQTAINDIASLTVIGPNVYEADRFATAAFAMGKNGIDFIERYPQLEGYQINHQGVATFTSGFERYL